MHAIHWKKQAINDLIKIGLHIAGDSPMVIIIGNINAVFPAERRARVAK